MLLLSLSFFCLKDFPNFPLNDNNALKSFKQITYDRSHGIDKEQAPTWTPRLGPSFYLVNSTVRLSFLRSLVVSLLGCMDCGGFPSVIIVSQLLLIRISPCNCWIHILGNAVRSIPKLHFYSFCRFENIPNDDFWRCPQVYPEYLVELAPKGSMEPWLFADPLDPAERLWFLLSDIHGIPWTSYFSQFIIVYVLKIS